MRPLRMSAKAWLDREVRVTPRTPPPGTPPRILPAVSGTAGYLSVVPLQRADGTWLLLARGWCPRAQGAEGAAGQEPAASAAASVGLGGGAPITVTGVLRASEQPGQWAVKVGPASV